MSDIALTIALVIGSIALLLALLSLKDFLKSQMAKLMLWISFLVLIFLGIPIAIVKILQKLSVLPSPLLNIFN